MNPKSYAYENTEDPNCKLTPSEIEEGSTIDLPPIILDQNGNTGVTFTYSVYFIESDTVWATRWDKYLHVFDPKIQWFSLINVSLVVLSLSFIMSHILIRALKNDIQKYNEINLDDDVIDEMGWKLIHGDIFRPPSNPMLLSVLIGSEVLYQLLCLYYMLVLVLLVLLYLLQFINSFKVKIGN
ncbi:unnamed protein product [[Candida] boidinii]|nr:unnamed protein product [[Candida] boidinii]